jgi:preprotein translocase subunit SecE
MNLNQIYKRDQGRKTRIGTGLVLLAIVAIGCVRLYQMLQASPIAVQTLVPVAICGVLGLVIFRLLNKPSLADFLIAAEGEIKKVSWSSWKEIKASTLVVISVVVLMAVGLGAADLLFFNLFGDWIGLY